MESALQQKESKVERALMDAAAIKQEMEKRLAEKDEELQSVRQVFGVMHVFLNFELLLQLCEPFTVRWN